MTVKHECSGKAYDVIGWHRCFRNATVERDGRWYCWQHDPRYIAEKVAERRAGQQAEMDREAAKYVRIARNARLGALITEETAALLERLAREANLGYEDAGNSGDSGADWAVQLHIDENAARALAAHIREALALEANDD